MEEVKKQRDETTEKTCEPKEADIARFLLRSGFNETSLDIVNTLARLVVISMKSDNLVVGQACAALAEKGKCGNTLRAKLGYHIRVNYQRVRQFVLNEYRYEMGKFYSGVKSFVEQIAIVCSMFVREI